MKIEKTIVRILVLMSLTVLMGCSADSEPETSEMKTAAVEVVSFVTGYDEANKVNRAWAIPSGFVAYEGGEQSIGIAFTQDGVDPTTSMIGNFFKSGDKWRTSLEEIQPNTPYQLYGYIPESPAIKYSITDIRPEDNDDEKDETDTKYDGFSTGAIMTLQNVPTVMPNDLCVVIGAKHGTDKEHDSGLRQGDFNFTASANKDYVFLLFDHLYAALRIQMKVHADYAALRTIKLKSLQLDTQAGEKKTTKKTTITIKLKANDGSASPIEELTFTPTGEKINGGLEFWSDTYGEQLTTEFKPFIGHFMPSGITKLILTSTYDVYDRKGNLIRQNDEAINTIDIQELFSGQTQALRGRRYTINMTINPTYLYMLSEPDLDNPTVTIN